MKILITGGAGFIGTNAASNFAMDGWDVTILDNLSRKGSKENLAWLKKQVKVKHLKDIFNKPISIAQFGGNYEDFSFKDNIGSNIEDLLKDSKQPFNVILHLAAQVAVTVSVKYPIFDFESNALNTLLCLEAIREHSPNTMFINASTNKVYGKMDDMPIIESDKRYEIYQNQELKQYLGGVKETQPLDFYSPYGCSKGSADQYTLDYARIYGIKTTSFRQSCIYGPHQMGIEDQGWVAWFTIAAMMDKPITIYGDGKQVRDILFVDDLVDAYKAAINNKDKIQGQAYNIGGGPGSTLSLLELIEILEKKLNKKIPVKFADWRPGDQKVFVSNINKADNDLDWQPKVSPEHGIDLLIEWASENMDVLENVL